MNFQSLGFLAFLTVTAAACLTAARRDRRAAAACLIFACLFFYIAGGGWTALLVPAAGLGVSFAAISVRSPRCLILAAVWHIGVLAAFKWIFPGWFPLGLSFFTFQQLWLLREAYTGGFRPGQGDSLLLYTFFFPTVVSGPILKPQAFFPQLHGEAFLRPGGQDFAAGLYAIAMGTAKKALLADSLGTVVNCGWDRLDQLSAPAAWLVILGYTLQLYLDFSGYCNIAAGAARLLGLRLPVNFDAPYRSLSVGEFWKRWHITLTSFLRECLYFPLGGGRKGRARTYVNILIVFLVSGLWHGTGWTFLIWGGLHGLAQIAERAWGKGRDALPKLLRWAMTFSFVNAAWVFFRAPCLSDAATLLRAAVAGGLTPPGAWLLEDVLSKEALALRILLPAWKPWISPALTFVLFGAALLAALRPAAAIRRMETFRPTAWSCLLLALLSAWSVLSFTGITTFIYSNF